MAKAVPVENPERARREPSFLGVSRVAVALLVRFAKTPLRARKRESLSGGRRASNHVPFACRRTGRPDRRHPTRKGRPETRKGDGIVQPGAPREGVVGSARGSRERPSGPERTEGRLAERPRSHGGIRTVARPLVPTNSAPRGRVRWNGNTPRGRELSRGFSRHPPMGRPCYARRHGMARRFIE
jgi:hypothetical protein